MLTPQLRTLIDDRWKAFWPASQLKPLAILDFISYFLLIKKIDEQQLILSGRNLSNNKSVYSRHQDELRWNRFKDLDSKSLYTLFTKENGVINFMNNYGQVNHLYSKYLKEPLLLAPTPKILMNTVEIIKIMEAEDPITQAEIYEYLLCKQELAGQNGQVFVPSNIVKLIVTLIDPTADDLIWDPSAGNGSLLVNCINYIKNKSALPGNRNKILDGSYKGMDFDLVQLRIAAVNMMLNGIENPALEIENIFKNVDFNLQEQPTLILSNLYFKSSEDKLLIEPNTTKTDQRWKKEIAFLNVILKNLKPGGRAALIIPEVMLYDNGTDLVTAREQIINESNLEAVISLPGTATSLFSHASILIFNKSISKVTDKVGFYKMNEDTIQDKGVWKIIRDNSFFVSADEIRNNNYNLSCKEYKRFEEAQHSNKIQENVSTAQKAVEINDDHLSKRTDEKITSPEEIVNVVNKDSQAVNNSITPISTVPTVPEEISNVRKTDSQIFDNSIFDNSIDKIIISPGEVSSAIKTDGQTINSINKTIPVPEEIINIRETDDQIDTSLDKVITAPEEIANVRKTDQIVDSSSDKRITVSKEILNLKTGDNIDNRANKIISAPKKIQTEKTAKTVTSPVIAEAEPMLRKRHSKKRLHPVTMMLIIIFTGAVLVYIFYYKDKKNDSVVLSKQSVSPTAVTLQPELSARQRDTARSSVQPSISTFKRLRDTIKIPAPAVPANINATKKISITHALAKQNTVAAEQPVQPANITPPSADFAGTKQKYTVIDVAHFHNQPDESTGRRAFINHWNNAVLNPLDDKNGFIYIVYTNDHGQTSRGWLNKKDLRTLR